jgi:hypothetical protein
MRMESLEKVAKALGVTVDWLRGDDNKAPTPKPVIRAGFAESQAEPWQPPPTLDTADSTAALDWIGENAKHPVHYRVTATVPSLCIQAGDILVVDLNAPPKDGDIILVGATRPDGQSTATLIRRHISGMAISAEPSDPHPALHLDAFNVWRGTVRGLVRITP